MRADSSSNGDSHYGGNGDGHNGHNGDDRDTGIAVGEPVLSADELRALLQEQPFLPPHSDD